MKKFLSSACARNLQIAALLGFFYGISSWAATLSVFPSAVSNTYAGIVTLQIGDLTNGETVKIGKLLDANANGVLDSADLLVQGFKLIDGRGMPVIGGVTNIYVPGDSTPTNGAITAQLNLSTSGIEQRFVGQYAFKLVSPTDRFEPVTTLFNVTNFPYSQSFAGAVTCSDTNVPNASVLLFPGQVGNSSPQAAAVADNSGSYMIKVPPGTYGLVALKSGFVADAAAAPTLTLGTNATITTNLSLLPATCSISGKFVDASNTNNGLPGILVVCQSTNYLMAISFTDTNGDFIVPVTASQWEVSLDSEELPSYGYLDLQSRPFVDTTTGSVAGVTIALPKGTALFYGSVKDNQNRPLAGLRIFAEDDSDQYEGTGITDQNGDFVIAVIGGNWQVGADSSSPGVTDHVFPQAGYIAITNGQAIQLNILAIPATNTATGYVTDAIASSAIVNVGVNAWANLNGTNYNQYARTDSDGFYSLNLASGNWTVSVNCHCEDDDCLGSEYQCPENQMVIISNNNAVVNFAVYPIWMPMVSQPARFSPTQFGFNLSGAAGSNYTVLATTNVALPLANWFTVLTTNLPDNSAFVQDNQATNEQRFYRVKIGL